MAITINPVLPVLAAQEVGGVVPELVLAPGSVITAQVLKVLSADLVRIAIASLSIDVLSEIPLQQGQSLQLAVSQTRDGIRLAVVGQGGNPAAASGDAVSLSPEALVDASVSRPTIVAPSRTVLTPLERAVVSGAAQRAATGQGSLAPLFANLGAAASTGSLPLKLQQAIVQVLAQQTSLDQNLGGGDIRTAFQKSGLFLEASLAAGSIPSTGVPDLKAALIVLRQALQTALGTTATVATPGTAQAGLPDAAAPNPVPAAATTATRATATTTATPVATQAALPSNAAPDLAPLPPSEPGIHEIVLPQARLPVAEDLLPAGGAGRNLLTARFDTGPTSGAPLNLLQEALQEPGRPTAVPKDIPGSDVTVHVNTPPPPFRGASPSAQPVAVPSIAPDASLSATTHHLLADTDAAIARQTLLQVASLPDRIDGSGPKIDPAMPRWNFEIPFVTPHGTAMAQFEISRDAGDREIDAARQVWRARFSLDVEPAGPVHAAVTLTGETTSVRMWAERPTTAARLRDGAAQLSQALSRAELRPGDIVIRDGAPPQTAAARAGHFLDRAL